MKAGKMKINSYKVTSFIARWFFAVLVLAIILVPIYWIFISSITPATQLYSSPVKYWPDRVTLENYMEIFVKLDMLHMIRTTLLVTFCSLGISIILSMFAAYVFARNTTSRLMDLLFAALLATTLIPVVVTTRPLYDLMNKLKLFDTMPGLVLLYTSNLLPFSVLILSNCVKRLPASIEEAGEIDGCGLLAKLFYIVFPLMKPAIATVAIINFINCINDLFTPLFFSNRIRVLSLGLTQIPRQSSYEVPWDLISAMGCCIVAPIIIFVLVFEENIMDGIVAGGVKE